MSGRLSRATVADRERELSLLEADAVMGRVRARVRRQYVKLQAAQDRILLSQEFVALAQQAHGLAVEKVAAGKAPPTDSLQSLIALSKSRIDSGKAAGELTVARHSLAAACGVSESDFDAAQGRMTPAFAVPSWEVFSKRIPESPEWKRIGYGAKVREAEVRSEKIARIPPVTLEAGIRRVPEKEGRAFVANLTLPLPAWNWNQGAIRAAKSRRVEGRCGREGGAAGAHPDSGGAA